MNKFYHAENAGRPYAGQRFDIYEQVAGTICGVFATDDPTVIAELDKLIGQTPVRAIDEAEYQECAKKKRTGSEPWTPLSVSMTPTEQRSAAAIKGTGVVSVASKTEVDVPEGQEGPVEIKTQVETVEDALVLGDSRPEGSTPDAMVAPPEKTREAFSNKKRKK